VRGGTPVLHDANWTVNADEHWFVLGRNGCGKSTLMGLVMATLWSRRGGSVEVLGQHYGKIDTREMRKRLGWIGADLVHHTKERALPINVVLSGFDASIGLYRESTPEEIELARDKMAELGVADLAERAFGTLSAGEQMRILIARATIHNPAILILDEPCSHLDLPAREEFLQFLDEIANQSNAPTLIQVTHRIDDVSTTFSHGLVIKEGRIIAAGPRRDVLVDSVLSEAYGLPVRLYEVADRFWPAVTK
jgi:iron complex transport system ATP-binding protein